MRLLIVEDEVRLASALQRGLANEGFTVDLAHTGPDGLHMAQESTYDAVVLDIMLPGLSGYRIIEQLRAAENWVPILMLTAKDGEYDEADALDLGADDYLTKPFSFVVLLARLRALLRRSQAATSAVLSFGPIELDTAGRRAGARQPAQDDESEGKLLPIDLGPREWTVLEYLLIHAPKPASKDKLLQALTGWDREITPNAVEVYVSRLRSKLEPHGVALRSIRGFGYRLELSHTVA